MRQKIYAYIEDEFSIFHDFMWKWSSMLNYLWAAMIVIGIVYGALSGNVTAVSDGALDSAKEAVTFVHYHAWCDVSLDGAYGNCQSLRTD